MKNYGLIIDPLHEDDFILGSSQSLDTKYGDTTINPSGDWTPFLPPFENQSTPTGDTFACVSYGTNNAIELLARCLALDTENLSDRFVAKLSNTVVGTGNSPKRVADFIRHNWSTFEDEWPDVNTVEEYYADVPMSLQLLAKARGANFEFGYEWVTNSIASIKTALKSSPVCIAVTAWMEKDGVYVRAPWGENHWATIIAVLPNGNLKILDSFPPYIKEVKPEAAQSVAMRYFLSNQVVKPSRFKKFIRQVLAILEL